MSVSINDIENREQLISLVIGQLRENGVKYRKETKPNNKKQDKITYGKIFYIPLQYLDSVEVHVNGIGAVQVPTFVVNACKRILNEVSTIGIFRKTGSSNRQKQIIVKLERGLPFDESDNVIDIACILKTFFRSLPEALIPPGNIQETFIRCLLNDNSGRHCVLLTCLLLPPIVLNTLAYFMQFLSQVALYADTNKMTVSNLAIILAPTIMPVLHNIQQRQNSHVKIIEMLIGSANEIGVVPEVILDQLQKLNVNEAALLYTQKKKKKRRSGSLTRMFNGFRKIVGALGSSNESLERLPVDSTTQAASSTVASLTNTNDVPTPCLTKSAKKRRVNDGNPFSARKRKDLLSLLPEGSAILPNASVAGVAVKEAGKKSRITLNPNALTGIASASHDTGSTESVSNIQPMDRRWSLVSTPWQRGGSSKKTLDKGEDKMLHCRLSPVVSLPSLSTPERHSEFDDDDDEIPKSKSEEIMRDQSDESDEPEPTNEVSFVKVPRTEYEAIKERVSAIETQISEIGKTTSAQDDSFIEPIVCSGPDSVQEKFEKTIEDTNPINCVATTTDQLAKRLSRELKIRRSTEHQIIRSPSARKIGTIRRRSRENVVRLSRSTTWHLGTTNDTRTISDKIDSMSKESLCLRSNLKRGRPNTVLTGLRYPSPIRKQSADETGKEPTEKIVLRKSFSVEEKWYDANKFFNDPTNDYHDLTVDDNLPQNQNQQRKSMNPKTIAPMTPEVVKQPTVNATNTASVLNEMTVFKTPVNLPPRRERSTAVKSSTEKSTPKYVTSIEINNKTTPVLPPRKTTPTTAKMPATKTPSLPFTHAASTGATNNNDLATGRASIARIRSQNAGHVAAKARLFDTLASSTSSGGNGTSYEQHQQQLFAANLFNKSVPGPKNLINQHSVNYFRTGERLAPQQLHRVLKENNVVPRIMSPRSRAVQQHNMSSPSTPKRRQAQAALRRQRLRMMSPTVTDSPIAVKKMRKHDIHAANKLQTRAEELGIGITKRRLSEFGVKMTTVSENRSPARKMPVNTRSPRSRQPREFSVAARRTPPTALRKSPRLALHR